MTELLETVKSIFNNLGSVTITEEFISLRNKKMAALNKGDRTPYTFAMNVDCLILEEWLIKNGIVEPPLKEHGNGGACPYDCRLHLLNSTAYIDFKCIDQNLNYNVSIQKLKSHSWVQEAIDDKILTHYCFYRMYRPSNNPLIVGDVVKFELINVLNAQFVVNSLQPSKFENKGKFYKVKKYV